MNEHISFDEMTEYVFGKSSDVSLSYIAKMNNHIMNCTECQKMYYELYSLKEVIYGLVGESDQVVSVFVKVLGLLYEKAKEKDEDILIDECMNFKIWLSFNIERLSCLKPVYNQSFTSPHLITVMKSSTNDDSICVNDTFIRSSLYDKDMNRVCIGLDGTLSLYFDADNNKTGQRVLLIPDDDECHSRMIEMKRYDDSISYVRFEGIIPGKYTVVIEKG